MQDISTHLHSPMTPEISLKNNLPKLFYFKKPPKMSKGYPYYKRQSGSKHCKPFKSYEWWWGNN